MSKKPISDRNPEDWQHHLFEHARGQALPQVTSMQPAAPNWQGASHVLIEQPNVCNLTGSPEGFTIDFGVSQGATLDSASLSVRPLGKLQIKPITAKLLRDLLIMGVKDFEERNGTIPSQYQLPAGGLGAAGPIERSPKDWVDIMGEKARLLFGLIDGLGLPYRFERSFKLMTGQILGERFLMGINISQFTQPAMNRLPVICKRLGLPTEHFEALLAELRKATVLHFGYEDDGREGVYKIYFEYVDALRQPVPQDGVVLFNAFKWSAGQNPVVRTSAYRCFPGLTPTTMVERTATAFGNGAGPLLNAAIGSLLGLLDDQNLLYQEVSETDSARHSFDINVYSGGLELAEIYPVLHRLGRGFGISVAAMLAHYSPNKHERLGHVSGGLDRHGDPFVTIYFGAR